MPQLLRQRLFWKILLGFWVTFILITQGLWAYITLVGREQSPLQGYHQQASAPLITSAVAWVLEHQGPAALPALLDQWPKADRKALTILGPDTPPPQADARTVQRTATTPGGDRYQIVYQLPEHEFRPNRRRAPWDIPHEIIILGVIGGLTFAAVLAWYLARPIHRLRRGFGRLAAGDFAVRLSDDMGRRRDELADLATSFDQMAARLQHLVQAREQLLHDVSHELRSPLARLQLAVGLARQAPHKIAPSLDRIESEGQRLDDLVGELLTLSRVEAGARDGESYFDAHALILALISDAQFEAQASHIKVIAPGITENSEGPTLRGNPRLVRRALENVIRNALRFSPQGGTVEVTVTPQDNENGFPVLAITIGDQGPGVDPNTLGRIFDPFVRGPNARADSGFGLGLSIARRTIEAHGGAITAHNRTPSGLCVTVTLPL
jgi:two-component system OmpR family sensor kinase